jgi:hypothetical protein
MRAFSDWFEHGQRQVVVKYLWVWGSFADFRVPSRRERKRERERDSVNSEI